MKNYVQSIDKITLTAPTGGVTAGDPYDFGTLVVIATKTVAAAERFVGLTTGVFTGLARNTGDSAWTVGVSLYLEATGKELTTTATANYFGKCLEARVSAATTTGLVLLNGSAGNKAT